MTDELRIDRVIDAPPDVVFDTFTAEDGRLAFYGQDDPGWIVESYCDLRVGGVWTIRFGPSRSHLYRHRHVFEVIDRPRRLVLATTESRPDGSSFDFAIEVHLRASRRPDPDDHHPVRLPHRRAPRGARARSAEQPRPTRTRHPREQVAVTVRF
ncbi:MAG: SRPBCC domain-containing protein [Actinomycetota bacterium]|nr:SRPBCC domain-containing protein [Actinomycetota bacterium]